MLKALKGLVVMSQALEDMSTSLFNNMVPGMWAGKVMYFLLFISLLLYYINVIIGRKESGKLINLISILSEPQYVVL